MLSVRCLWVVGVLWLMSVSNVALTSIKEYVLTRAMSKQQEYFISPSIIQSNALRL